MLLAFTSDRLHSLKVHLSADALAGEVAFVEGTFVVVGFQFVDGEIDFFDDLVFHMVGLGDCLV